MCIKTPHLTTLTVWIFFSFAASGAGIFYFEKLPPETREAQRQAIEAALDSWTLKVLNDSDLAISSNFNVYFTGEDFVDLVNMGPDAVPYMFEKLTELGFAGFFYGRALDYMLRGYWEDVAGLQVIRWPPESKPDAQVVEQAILWWKNVSKNCAAAWVERRKAFDERLAQRPIIEEDMNSGKAEPEWLALRMMGILAVPSIMQRIHEGKSDSYDLKLLSLCIPPLEVEMMEKPRARGGQEKVFVPSPKFPRGVPKVVYDVNYWIPWWEANKKDFWWLLE